MLVSEAVSNGGINNPFLKVVGDYSSSCIAVSIMGGRALSTTLATSNATSPLKASAFLSIFTTEPTEGVNTASSEYFIFTCYYY